MRIGLRLRQKAFNYRKDQNDQVLTQLHNHLSVDAAT